MKKLLRLYMLNSDMQYLQMMVDNHLKGAKDKAQQLFKAMPKQYRILFVRSALDTWNTGIKVKDIANDFVPHI